MKLASPDPLVQLPGERDEMVYLPLGVGVVIPPWNFPLAIMLGMTVAALVTGNTVVIKPSSDTPDHRARNSPKLLHEAGFPPGSILAYSPAAASHIGDLLVIASRKRASSRSQGRATWVCTSTNWLPKRLKGQVWIKRVVAEMGGKDAIVVDRDCESGSGGAPVFSSRRSAIRDRSVRPARAPLSMRAIYDEFLEKLKAQSGSS